MEVVLYPRNVDIMIMRLLEYYHKTPLDNSVFHLPIKILPLPPVM